MVTIQLKNIVRDLDKTVEKHRADSPYLIRIVGGQKRSTNVADAMESVEELVSSFTPLLMIWSNFLSFLLTLEACSSTLLSCAFLFLAMSHLGDSGSSHQRTSSSRLGAERTERERLYLVGSRSEPYPE